MFPTCLRGRREVKLIKLVYIFQKNLNFNLLNQTAIFDVKKVFLALSWLLTDLKYFVFFSSVMLAGSWLGLRLNPWFRIGLF